jgi:hypothetical protein
MFCGILILGNKKGVRGMARKLKERYVLIDAQEVKKLELHVAFYGKDNDDQIVCELPESVVVELVKKEVDHIMPTDFEVDSDVVEHIVKKYSL